MSQRYQLHLSPDLIRFWSVALFWRRGPDEKGSGPGRTRRRCTPFPLGTLSTSMPPLAGQAGVTEAVGLVAEIALLDPRRSPAGDALGHTREMLAKMAGGGLVALGAVGRARRRMPPTRHGPAGGGVAGLARDAEAASVRIFSGVAGRAVEVLGSLCGQWCAGRPQGAARLVEQPRQGRKGAGFGRLRGARRARGHEHAMVHADRPIAAFMLPMARGAFADAGVESRVRFRHELGREGVASEAGRCLDPAIRR